MKCDAAQLRSGQYPTQMDKCRKCSEYKDGRTDGFAGQPCVYAENIKDGQKSKCIPHNFAVTQKAKNLGFRISVTCPRKCAGARGSWFAFAFLSPRARVCMPYFLEFGYSLFYSPSSFQRVHIYWFCLPLLQ